ncbi:M48 family metallopeptidase [Marinihelvus fidelis]|uniref:M48 family metallopeptidase n=1 Tax=Marinihelvus fidelis TaxID=2613842 RepID=A0A5N0TFD3_9GAMM|nr:M48 family metallopeptidase [Marinihelvus fidelis]KAA9132586.1 M48 family metallopeptidase [Marinihelvus fidelis]
MNQIPIRRSQRTLLARLLVFALVTSLLVACATSPTGRRQLMLVSEDSAIASSKEAYVSTVSELQKEGKLSSDQALVRRVERITGRLITEAIAMRPDSADWEWSVVVIDDPQVNAWCMAGGRMAMYTGLVNTIQPTDDELAQVMGHEIAHALANHSAEKMSVQMASSIGVAAVGIFADNKAIATSGAALAAVYAVNMPNSRTAETEADRIGIELAAKAGFDPRAAATLWAKMAKDGGASPPQFLSTHPDPANRQKKLAELEPEMMRYYDPKAPHPVYPL